MVGVYWLAFILAFFVIGYGCLFFTAAKVKDFYRFQYRIYNKHIPIVAELLRRIWRLVNGDSALE